MPDNGWKNVRPRSRMHAIDKGYQGSEKKLHPYSKARAQRFGVNRWK